MLGSAPLAALAVLCFGGVGVYIVNPSLMSWSSVHVPNSIRWLGAGLGWTGALGEIWALVYLGRQYSPILRVRRGHELVVQGPYAWVRHPVYSFGMPMLAGLGLVAANWLIVATGIAQSPWRWCSAPRRKKPCSSKRSAIPIGDTANARDASFLACTDAARRMSPAGWRMPQ